MALTLFSNLFPSKGRKAELYGTKPVIPDFPTSSGILGEMNKANIANFAGAQQTASKANVFNQQQILEMLEWAMPGFVQPTQKRLAAEARGELDPSLFSSVMNQAAARGLSGGYRGGIRNNITLRDLNLTAYDVAQRSLTSAQQWLSFASAPFTNVTSMFVSPQMQAELSLGKYERDLYAAQVKAAPDPGVRGEFDTKMELLGMVLSIYGGGAGYKNTYQGVSGGPQYAGAGSNVSRFGTSTLGSGRGFGTYGGGGGGSVGGSNMRTWDYNSGMPSAEMYA